MTGEAQLNRIRKRGKRILIAMEDELGRVLLMAMLHQDGYRCMFEAKSLVQALNFNRNVALDLLGVDHTIGTINADMFVNILRENGLPQAVPVVVIQRSVDHRLTLAAKAGKLNYLVEHPVDFHGRLKQPLERILNLEFFIRHLAVSATATTSPDPARTGRRGGLPGTSAGAPGG